MNDNNNTDSDIIVSSEISEELPVAPPAVENSWFGFVPMALVFVMFYFFLIRPQEKKRREHENFISTIKLGEEVVTNSGLFGVITKINTSEDTILLRIAKDVEIKVLKSAISDITSRKKAVDKKLINNESKKK
ncbi:MAG: preprotein translocase subunit YajC [Rickettsiaceae bacterium]|nr:preprotein translocase subunit YajC [Rickettsiaceae bacterium]